METIESLKKYAEKLMFNMEDEEYKTLLSEFEVLEKKFDIIANLENIKEVEPMVLPFEIEGVTLREDEVKDTISTEEAFSNAEKVKNNQIIVPKVVGE